MSAHTFMLDINRLLATPGAPTVTPQGTTGATTYTYKIVKKNRGTGTGAGRPGSQRTSDASAGGSTATGNAVLSPTNFNRVTWTNDAGANDGYDVYRTVGGATQGKVGSVAAGVTQFDDTGFVADGTTAPAVNTTGLGDPAGIGDLERVLLQFKGTFVATVQIQGQINVEDTLDEWFDIGAAKTAVGGLAVVVDSQVVTVQHIRAKETAFTSGQPVVVGAGV